MFGAAGLLADRPDGADPETAEYLDQLQAVWQTLDGRLKPSGLSAAHWHFGATRPTNYPTRRMAALARLSTASGRAHASRDARNTIGE